MYNDDGWSEGEDVHFDDEWCQGYNHDIDGSSPCPEHGPFYEDGPGCDGPIEDEELYWYGHGDPKPDLKCAGCGKSPDELPEYADIGYDDNVAACWNEEGTLNLATGKFLCNWCYIKAGMPSSPQGWTVPSSWQGPSSW